MPITLVGISSHRITDDIITIVVGQRQQALEAIWVCHRASSCIAETHDEMHVTAYLHLQVATPEDYINTFTLTSGFDFRRYMLSRRAPANPSRAQPRPPSAFVCYI